MDTVIYIEITKEVSFDFSKPLLNKIRAEKVGCTVFDIDNHSEPYTINCAVKLLEDAADVLIVVHAISEGTVRKLFPFYNKVIKLRSKLNLIMLGDESVSEKMFSPLHERFTKAASISELEMMLVKE
ncbi:hypothetical protein V6R21_27085 [Limibacter armeniacum]|uniref:hypothetical protein n=1 Tax=Limibacter armeniacum TaxID=466084 RepID=UPI002FE679CD